MSQEEQTRRLEARIDDGRETWKLSPMDLKSYHPLVRVLPRARRDVRGDGYAMGSVVEFIRSDKKRARLNVNLPLLKHIPYEDVPRDKVSLPERQKPHGYKELDYPFKLDPS